MKYLDYLNGSITPYHAVDITAKKLLENGFQELSFQSKWSLEPSKAKRFIGF
jgi:aspartyl aminopeptidase